MKFAPLGRSYSTGNLLFDPISDDDLVTHRKISQTSKSGAVFRTRGPRPPPNPADPKEAGWTFLIDINDPQKTEIAEILQKLAVHRIGKKAKPLEFDSKSDMSSEQWKITKYDYLDLQPGKKPYYILIAGTPDRIPFNLQSELDVDAAVGRVCFDKIEDLQSYVDKLIRLEASPKSTVSREVTFFATDHEMVRDEDNNLVWDPTHFSLNNMVNPMIDFTKTNPDIGDLVGNIVPLLGKNATKKNLQDILSTSKSALIFTASHGLGVPLEYSEEDRKQLTGSICCQDSEPTDEETLFCADDIPDEGQFLEGSIFFQFSCFGYGTPAESDFEHWFVGRPGWNKATKIAEKDMISPIPKKLLAHKSGPVAFIGHLDVALLDGFYDPNSVSPEIDWHPRLAPYQMMVKALLRSETTGSALNHMNARYNSLNATINRLNNLIQKKKDVDMTEFATAMLHANDAKNFLLFGDPFVYLNLDWV